MVRLHTLMSLVMHGVLSTLKYTKYTSKLFMIYTLNQLYYCTYSTTHIYIRISYKCINNLIYETQIEHTIDTPLYPYV